MTTLAANQPRDYEGGNRNALPVVATDIIYEGAAVGRVAASGHARPLTAADAFAGFAEAQADNSAGAAAAINVRLIESGKIRLAVTGAVISDVGQPVYASDDDTFTFVPTGGVFIGLVHRFVSAGIVIVAFDAARPQDDPYVAWPIRETLTGTKTFDAADAGKAFFVTADGDGDALTLPAIADGLADLLIVAIGAYGSMQLKIDPNANDDIRAPDVTAAANKDLLLTKATQRRGDGIYLTGGDADGYVGRFTSVDGTVPAWTREA